MKKPLVKKVSKLRWVPLYIFFAIGLLSWWIGQNVDPFTQVSTQLLDVKKDGIGRLYFTERGDKKYPQFVLNSKSMLLNGDHSDTELIEYVSEEKNGEQTYMKVSIKKHFKYWSLLPAIMAIALCWITKEPLTSLIGGIISGALLLQKYNITEDVFVTELMTKNAAGVLILYLWLLGALMGIWSKTGAAQAFGELMTRKFVNGPRSAKLVAWGLGVLFGFYHTG